MVFTVFQMRNDNVLGQNSDKGMKRREEMRDRKTQQNLVICAHINRKFDQSQFGSICEMFSPCFSFSFSLVSYQSDFVMS